MSIFKELALTCDGQGCSAFEVFEGTGDAPGHAAAASGWRWTPTGRCLCPVHARREWPGSFARTGSNPVFDAKEPEPLDELLS